MNLQHTIDDDVYNNILDELRDIKAISQALAVAAEDGLEPENVPSLGYLIYKKTREVQGLMEAVEKDSQGIKAPAPAPGGAA